MRRRKRRGQTFCLRLLGIFLVLCGFGGFGRITLAQTPSGEVDLTKQPLDLRCPPKLNQELRRCPPTIVVSQTEKINSRLDGVAAVLLVTALTTFGGLSLVHKWRRR